MGTIDPDAAICVKEPIYNVGAEHVASSTIRKLEACSVVVGVGPH